MGIFGNDYDSGYRSGRGFRGQGGDRGGWRYPRGENRLMDGVDRHYDRDHTFQSGRYGAYTGRGGNDRGGNDRGGYDRDMGGHGAPAMWNTWEHVLGDNLGAGGGYGARGYDRGYRGGTMGGGMTDGRGGYDAGYGYRGRGGYDRGYVQGRSYDREYGPRNADLRSDVGHRQGEEPRGMLGRWARGWGFGVGQDDRGGRR